MSEIKYLSVDDWQKACNQGVYLTVRIPLVGNSMMPLVRRNRDIVTIAPLMRDLLLGDIVLFQRSDGSYVVHRLWRMQGPWVLTVGDGCMHPDAPMPHGAILGLVTHLERDGRTLHLDTPFWRGLGRMWLGLLPVRRPMRRLVRGIKRRLRPWVNRLRHKT